MDMTLKEMKMALCEIYVGFWRANARLLMRWDDYMQSDHVQAKARTVAERMNDRFYTIHIPRWMSHLGMFYAQKDHASGNIKIYHKGKDGEKIFWRTIPLYADVQK